MSHIFMWLQKSSEQRELMSGKYIKAKKLIICLYITENHCIYFYMYKMFLPKAFKIIICSSL